MKTLNHCITLLLLTAVSLTAAPIVVPPGLNPGDTYRLVFYANQRLDGVSNDIEIYNSFVSAIAASVPELDALDTSWRVLASTSTVNALVNAGLDPGDTSTRFYNTLGQLVATGVTTPVTGLYGGPQTSHSAGITDESGGSYLDLVYTGTTSSGQTLNPLGSSNPLTGAPFITHSGWTQISPSYANRNMFYFYAISGELTVPGAAPEPGSLFLMGTGAMLLVASRLCKCRA